MDDQIAALQSRHPQLQLVERRKETGVWIGPVQPTKQEYKVRIEYRALHPHEMVSLAETRSINDIIARIQPRVQVLSPALEFHPDYEEGPIPHVYLNKKDIKKPFLCLFDPRAAEWSPRDLLSETTVPWTARWLYFYEGWLATKKWFGGGVHTARAKAIVEI